MAQAKACKAIHVVACIKGIANQVKDWQVEDKKDQSQIKVGKFFHHSLLSLVTHMVMNMVRMRITPMVEPIP